MSVNGANANVTVNNCAACDSNSPQCCWVIQAWYARGSLTEISPTSETGCCSLVTCSLSSPGIVTELDWNYNGKNKSLDAIWKLVNLTKLGLHHLYGPPPVEIGNLTSLTSLNLGSARLTGDITATIYSLTNLSDLNLNGNPELYGTITPRCNMSVVAYGSSITICGCVCSSTPAFIFPPPETPLACLATGPASPLVKRASVFTTPFNGYQLTCNVDEAKNPYQNCMNTLVVLCNSTYIIGNSARITTCKTSIDQIFFQLNSTTWQPLPLACAPWKNGLPASSACTNANNVLIASAYYVTSFGNVSITSALTESIKQNLWSNPALIG